MTNRSTNRERQGTTKAQGKQLAESLNEVVDTDFVWGRFVHTLALNRIKWSGLPESVDERFLEQVLISDGRAVFYDSFEGKGKEPNILATRVVLVGPFDLYNNQNQYSSIGNGGHYQKIPDGEGVVVWDSRTRSSTVSTLVSFTKQLAELDRLAIKNRRQQQWAKIVAVDENAQIDLARLQRSLDSGEPYMMAIKGMDITATSLDLSTPYIQKDLQEDRFALMNRLNLFLGIKTQPFEKSQYMQDDEVNVADDVIARVREDLLSCRRKAAEAVNKKWGTEIKVDWMDEEFIALKNEPSVSAGAQAEVDIATNGGE